MTSPSPAAGLAGALALGRRRAGDVARGPVEDDRRQHQEGEVAGAHRRERAASTPARSRSSLDPDAPKDAVCKDCTDERKDKPVLGMTIIRNVKAERRRQGVLEGGDILDPNNGKVYKRAS